MYANTEMWRDIRHKVQVEGVSKREICLFAFALTAGIFRHFEFWYGTRLRLLPYVILDSA